MAAVLFLELPSKNREAAVGDPRRLFPWVRLCRQAVRLQKKVAGLALRQFDTGTPGAGFTRATQ